MGGVYDDVLESAAHQLAEAIWNRQDPNASDALHIDASVRVLLLQLGAMVTSLLLTRLAAQAVEGAKAAGLCINRSRNIAVTTLFGILWIASPYLRNRVTGESKRPVADQLGLTHRCKTPAVQRAMTDFGAETAFQLAADRFQEHYGHRPGRTSMLRVVEEAATAAEEYIARRLAACPPRSTPRPWGILIELDGCEIRSAELERPEKQSDTRLTPVRKLAVGKRPEGFRDVRLGFARAIGAERSSRIWVGGLMDYDDLAERLYRAALHSGLAPGVLVVAVVDGGNGLREALERRFKGLIVILDRPHLKSHLHKTGAEMGLNEAQCGAWVDLVLMRLSDGEVDAVIEALAGYEGTGAKRVGQLVKHLRRFADAVQYGYYKHFGMPIGSGEVEAGHRCVIQPRLKRPGAVWHPEILTPMVALRIIRTNGWWDDFWRDRYDGSPALARAA